MTALVFVDASVLLYAVDSREPGKQARAAQWMERLWRTQTGRTSTQVLSEFFVNATRRLDPGLTEDEAWQHVSALRAWDPQPVDLAALELAREIMTRYRISWWDSLIVAAAQLQGCSTLLTEDLQAGASYAGVAVRSPFSDAVQEAAGPYAPSMAPPPVRRRGRPRKQASTA